MYVNMLLICSQQGGMSVGDEKEQQVVLRPSISYNQKFGLHDVGALFLYEQTERKGNTLTGYRSDFALLDIDELPFGSTIHPTDGNFSSSIRQGYAGYVGRFNYAYNNRYLAEFTFRYDGSYHFKRVIAGDSSHRLHWAGLLLKRIFSKNSFLKWNASS